jgi:hypothetical protein
MGSERKQPLATIRAKWTRFRHIAASNTGAATDTVRQHLFLTQLPRRFSWRGLRVTHRCHIMETKGESYRLQDAKRRRRTG